MQLPNLFFFFFLEMGCTFLGENERLTKYPPVNWWSTHREVKNNDLWQLEFIKTKKKKWNSPNKVSILGQNLTGSPAFLDVQLPQNWKIMITFKKSLIFSTILCFFYNKYHSKACVNTDIPSLQFRPFTCCYWQGVIPGARHAGHFSVCYYSEYNVWPSATLGISS